MMSDCLITTPPAALRLTVACRLDRVPVIAHSVRHFLAQEGVAREDVSACELALVEGCNNAVLYAAAGERTEPIHVAAICCEEEILLEIGDHTKGFELPERVELPLEDSETGRGLFIIQSAMDRVEYLRGRGGNRLVLRRRRSGGEGFASRFMEQTTLAARLEESEQVISDMAEELSSCYESLSAIFRSGAELGKTNNLEEFSRNLCNDLLQITGADWYVLRAASKDKLRLELLAATEECAGPRSLGLADLSRPSAELKAAFGRKPVWFDPASVLPAEDPLAALASGCTGVVHPFFFADHPAGTLSVGKSEDKPSFTAAQANVIYTFADFAGIQITNARLHEEQVRTRLVSHELEIARSIQRALIPKSLPELPGLSLAGHCANAEQVGGDFYDVYPVGNDAMLLVIADVMGKGIPAAMFAASLRSLVRAAPELAQEPGALLARINRLLFAELSSVDMFITAQLALVDVSAHRLILASAGHCPVFCSHPGEPCVRRLSPEGLPLGILPEATFADEVCLLTKDCRILFYTDGLTDARNPRGEFFGEDRLVRWLEAQPNRPAPVLGESLLLEMRRFQEEAPRFDDQTFFLITDHSTQKNHVKENFSR